jgi:hypothetical protein
LRQLHVGREPPQCQGMLNLTDLASVPSDALAPFTDRLRLALAAYLARFRGSSRNRTESDPRSYLAWCTERGLDPLAAQRPHLELYIRWMQEIRRFQALHRIPAVVGHGRVLPDLRLQRRPGTLPPGRSSVLIDSMRCRPSHKGPMRQSMAPSTERARPMIFIRIIYVRIRS